MSELKPCPFCGGSSQYDTFHGQYRVECLAPKCLASGPWRPTLDEALAAWTAPLALAAAVQAEREACARAIGDLRTADTVTARAVVIDGMRAIRSRGPAPAVDVLGVVRDLTEALAEALNDCSSSMAEDVQELARVALAKSRALAPGAAANDKGEGR